MPLGVLEMTFKSLLFVCYLVQRLHSMKDQDKHVSPKKIQAFGNASLFPFKTVIAEI